MPDGWRRTDTAALPRNGVADAWRVDLRAEEANGDLFVSVQDPVMPPRLFYIAKGQAPERLATEGQSRARGLRRAGLSLPAEENRLVRVQCANIGL